MQRQFAIFLARCYRVRSHVSGRPTFAALSGEAMMAENEPTYVAMELLTVEEVAALLKVPKSWIYEKTRRRGPDALPHVKLGKYLRFDEMSVRAWLMKRKRG